MRKKFLTLILIISLIMNLNIVTFADSIESVSEISENNGIIFDGKVDTNFNEFQRGTSEPSSYWNLGNDYNSSGSFIARIWTNYYFSPNADGHLYLNYYFVPSETTPNRQFTIDLWNKNTNSIVATYEKIYTSSIGANLICSNLNPNDNYYFVFSKTFDDIQADLDFTISWD